MNTVGRKIITIEDPVEYQLTGACQMQVKPKIGFDFAAGLRSILRHDPDVIFITVKANALPLIASAIESFYHDGMYIVSWQNGIDTELEISKKINKKLKLF